MKKYMISSPYIEMIVAVIVALKEVFKTHLRHYGTSCFYMVHLAILQ
jgi:hypothetical protein